MSDIIVGDERRGAHFVSEHGLGVGEVTVTKLTDEDWDLNRPDAVQHLLDVVMLAHTLTRELAEVTGELEYEILFRVQRDGMAPDGSTRERIVPRVAASDGSSA